MTRSPSAPVQTANMDIAIAVKGAIQTTTRISTITAEAVRITTNTRQAAGMATTVPVAKATMIMNRRVRTTIKANLIGTMNTQEPIALGFQSALTTAILMLAMAITTSASTQLEATWPLHSQAPKSALEVATMY